MKRTIFMMLLLLVLPTAIMAQDVTFTATHGTHQGDFDGCPYAKAFDGDVNTKWCSRGESDPQPGFAFVQFKANRRIAVKGYHFITGDEVTKDGKNRNPSSWTLFAKVNENDGWRVIADVTDAVLPTNAGTQSQTFEVTDQETEYQYFQLALNGIVNGDVFELSEFGLDYWCLKYNLVDYKKTASVASNPGTTGDVVVPETVTIDGVDYTVTSIGRQAFKDCGGLTSVSIPNTVTSIADYAFWGCM